MGEELKEWAHMWGAKVTIIIVNYDHSYLIFILF